MNFKNLFFTGILPIFICITLFSCDCHKDILGIIKSNNGGEYTITNLSTEEQLIIEGSIHIGYKSFHASPGDKIDIKFKPKEDYQNYTFNTSYEFPDMIVEKEYDYIYTVNENLKGIYVVSLYAISEGEDKNNEWYITADAPFQLIVE